VKLGDVAIDAAKNWIVYALFMGGWRNPPSA